HRGLGQILPRPVGLQVVLHKDEVPDLELLPLLVQAHELFCGELTPAALGPGTQVDVQLDRKSTRLNSSHVATSYAVFSLKKNRVHSGYLISLITLPCPTNTSSFS